MTMWGSITTQPRKLPAPIKHMELEINYPEPESDSKPTASSFVGGIRAMYQKCIFYDVFLVCGKSRFPAHRAVLAASSPKFRELLLQLQTGQQSEQVADESAGRTDEKLPELLLEGSYSATTLSALLDFIYGLGEYSAPSDEANIEVLSLSDHLQIPALKARAALWLAEHLTVANAIPMLAKCEEFGLSELSEQIKEQLTSDTETLLKVTQEVAATQHPMILQGLLMRMATRKSAPEKRPPASPLKAEVAAETASAKPTKQTVKRAKLGA